MKKKPRLSTHEIDFLLHTDIEELEQVRSNIWVTNFTRAKIDNVVKSLTNLRKQLAESLIIK